MNNKLNHAEPTADQPLAGHRMNVFKSMKWLWFITRRLLTGQSAKFRITLGLVGILTSLVLSADMFGLFPDRDGAIRAGRIALAESVAVNATVFTTHSDILRMKANLAVVVERNEDVLSAAIRRLDGKAIATIGPHEEQWKKLADNKSTDTQLQVPIWSGDSDWGQVEIRFKPLHQSGLGAMVSRPLVVFTAYLGLMAFAIYYLYLGKMLTQLNPSKAIPSRVRSTLDTIAEGLLVLDSRERVVLANQAFSDLVGKSADDLLGFRVSDFKWTTTDGEQLNKSETPWRIALQTGESQRNTMLRLHISEDVRWTFMVNCSPILGSGGMAHGLLISFDDVTELENKEIELRKSKKLADDANKSKSLFLANMSHEIRTPMNAILGFTELLQRGYDRSAQETDKYLRTIHTSGKFLLELINDILDLSKVEAGNLNVERIKCYPHKIIAETINVLSVKAQEKGIKLDFEVSGHIPEYIDSDPVRLRQIITNLVGNAIKFTDSGGVSVKAYTMGDIHQSQFAIDITDSGIGMTKEQANNIFNPFVQADNSITRRFGGTGLGLSISKKFVEALGGNITVKSIPDKGSTFTVLLAVESFENIPLINQQQVLSEVEQVVNTEGVQWSFPESRVLVVDDGAENRELVKLVLEESGISVDVAENGKTGSDMALEYDYDVILMDVSMPVMDGFDATKRLRDKDYKHPIIALTAHAMSDVEEKCKQSGYSGFMTKPIDIDELLSVLADNITGAEKRVSKVVKAGMTSDNSVPDVKSSLSSENARIKAIIEKFVFKLDEKLKVVDHLWLNKDFTAIEKFAHWLKGSGGSVGFDILTERAGLLETYAKQQQATNVDQALHDLHQLKDSIITDNNLQLVIQSPAEEDSSGVNGVSGVIVSRFMETNPRMRPIITRFVTRLDEQLALMKKFSEQDDYEEIAKLAHWLKGAAGTVGFDDFTQPGKDLEIQAKEKDKKSVAESIVLLVKLARRICLDGASEKAGGDKSPTDLVRKA